MIFAALAAAVVAAAPPGGDTPTVSQLNVESAPKATTPPAATVEIPSDDSAVGEFASIWPAEALQARVSGHVVLTCDIDRYGLAEWCKVALETPEKMGFGAAALELRPTFKIKPAMGPDGPIDKVMNIAVEFKAPDRQIDWGSGRSGGPTGGGKGTPAAPDFHQIGGPPLHGRQISMLNNPVWASTVSYDDVVRAYPAKAGGVEGYAVAHCEVNRNGSLSDCQLIKEDPDKRGFGKAALSLASRFRVDPQWTTAPHHADLWVDVPVRFPAPGAPDARDVKSPYWVAGFDPAQALKVFPKEAADRGLAAGYGVAKCQVAADGTLTDCAPLPADPAGLGFSEAAVKLASTMRMNPWLPDGEPVDGTSVEVAVRLNLKSDQ